MNDKETKISSRETAGIFNRSMSCSQALMTVLDNAMGRPDPAGEQAAHPLAGGLIHMGYQCGILWGSTLSAGAEALRRFGPSAKAEIAAIVAAQKIMESFKSITGTHDCRDITQSDFGSFWGRMKYVLTGKAVNCGKLAIKWAPNALEALNGAFEGFEPPELASPVSCASMTALGMGASPQEAATCAGFAGGIGLSGNACGALAAAIWVATLKWYRENPGAKEGFGRALRQEMSQKIDFYPDARAVKSRFEESTGGKYLCSQITGRQFDSIKDHADFIRNGGCRNIIELFG